MLPVFVKNDYKATHGVSKVFAEIKGAEHMEPTEFWNDRWKLYAGHYFNCHLLKKT